MAREAAVEEIQVQQQPQRMVLSHGGNDEPARPAAPKREGVKIGRNDPCSCGSGKKYKRCCGK